MHKKMVFITMTLVMLLVVTAPVHASGNGNGGSWGHGDTTEEEPTHNNGNDNGNGNGGSWGHGGNENNNPPDDPGVGSGQDNTIYDTVHWVLPHGDTFIINGEVINIVDDWDNLDTTILFEPGNSNVQFVGIGGEVDYGDGSYQICGGGNGLGDCNGNGNDGDNGNGNGGPHHSDECGGIWVTPGTISATARQIAPFNAVIVGQDPDENGVTLEYHISITPTIVNYEDWRLIAHRRLACVEDDSNGNGNYGNGNNNDNNGNGEQNEYGCADNNCGCPNGWHPIIQHIWGCTSEQEVMREGIGNLDIGASLQLDSRVWVQTELANAYPGAHLINPDWSFNTVPDCLWADDVCTFTTTLRIPVADPGWYDIRVEGVTAGTQLTPARGFETVAGEFGVYLLDSTAMIQ